MYELLEGIDDPSQLRALDRKQLPKLAGELRDFMIESVSKTGGHLASNLGTVELTIALHYVFDTPNDRLVWDVGHQTYAHKILTGRRKDMSRLRKLGGIAGFPRRDESPYDTFGTGHSSTSISAALGMAVAAKQTGSERRCVAIIGDGAMTAGMAFEALNNAGAMDANVLVILNDNDMSISHNVGALSNYLAKLMSGRFYAAVRRRSEKVLGALPPILELAKRAEEHVKGMVIPGTMFEEFGFNYIGPIDGHDLDVLVSTLNNIRQLSGPQFLHVVTRKGKGYKLAEDDPCRYHGVTKFDPESGLAEPKASSARPSYTQVFGDWLCDMAALDERLI
jgi:1-deoxy-D-xylulose-5-phosphate synthase